MGLLDEFERWLIEAMMYDEDWALSVTRRDWDEDFLTSASNEDVESVLYSMGLFVILKVFGKKYEVFKWTLIGTADIEYGYMAVYILEMKTRTVVAYAEGEPSKVSPSVLEDMLRGLIDQVREAEKLLTARFVEK